MDRLVWEQREANAKVEKYLDNMAKEIRDHDAVLKATIQSAVDQVGVKLADRTLAAVAASLGRSTVAQDAIVDKVAESHQPKRRGSQDRYHRSCSAGYGGEAQGTGVAPSGACARSIPCLRRTARAGKD